MGPPDASETVPPSATPPRPSASSTRVVSPRRSATRELGLRQAAGRRRGDGVHAGRQRLEGEPAVDAAGDDDRRAGPGERDHDRARDGHAVGAADLAFEARGRDDAASGLCAITA